MTIFNFYGTTYYLMYTGTAFFALMEEFGDPSDMIEKISPNTKEAYSALCKIGGILSEQGAIYRSYMGYERTSTLDPDKFQAVARPVNMLALKRAVSNEVFSGLNREENEEEEIDLGLLELQKKTGSK